MKVGDLHISTAVCPASHVIARATS